MPRLTKRAVDMAAARPTRYTLFDDELKGFGLRIFPSGEKSWILEYRPAGGGRGSSKRRLTLGAVGALTPDQARKAAREALARVRLGGDPARDKANVRRALTFAELAECFLAEHVDAKRKPGTQTHYRDLLERIAIPHLGTVKAHAVQRSDIAKLHLGRKATPFQANRLLAVIGAMYVFAGRRGLVPEGTNPARGIEKYRERRRERFLTAEELERIGAALRAAETIGIRWEVNESHPNGKHLPKPHSRRTVLGRHAARERRQGLQRHAADPRRGCSQRGHRRRGSVLG